MNTSLLHTFTELLPLTSPTVFVNTAYHGLLRNYANQQTIIYTSFGESLHDNITQILSKFNDKHVIVVTTQKLAQVEQTANRNIITIPSAYSFYSTQLPVMELRLDDEIEKHFTSLNNRAQWTRLAVVQCVEQFNLYDKFFLSYHNHDRFSEGRRELYDFNCDSIGSEWYNDKIVNNELFSKLPIKLDNFLSNDWTYGRTNFYSQSFASLVTETYINENFDPFLTEKTFKPLAFGHPFLLSSSAGALSLIRSLGFETFGDIFDESYDNIESPQERMSHILREVVRICSLDKIELTKLRKHIRPILQRNYNFFWNEFHTKYLIEIEQVKNQIKELL